MTQIMSTKKSKNEPQRDAPDTTHYLLYHALETELGGVEVYTTALECAQNDDLRQEWEEYLEQTREHVQKIRKVVEAFGLDPEADTPGRQVV